MSFFRYLWVFINHYRKVLKEEILVHFRGEIIHDKEDLRNYTKGAGSDFLKNRRKQRERKELEDALRKLAEKRK